MKKIRKFLGRAIWMLIIASLVVSYVRYIFDDMPVWWKVLTLLACSFYIIVYLVIYLKKITQ